MDHGLRTRMREDWCYICRGPVPERRTWSRHVCYECNQVAQALTRYFSKQWRTTSHIGGKEGRNDVRTETSKRVDAV